METFNAHETQTVTLVTYVKFTELAAGARVESLKQFWQISRPFLRQVFK